MLEMRPDCEHCGGELMDGAARSQALQKKFPASTAHTFTE